jgi:nucleoside-triphosphatase
MAAKPVGKHVLITGPPGIGKTTLVQSVCGKLVDKGLRLRGFYTEELREGRNRIGFDVVSLTTKSRSPLARLNGDKGMPMVGRYKVDVGSFEREMLPCLETSTITDGGEDDIVVIDEIGKMELHSKAFCSIVRDMFDQGVIVVATVPIAKGKPLLLVNEIKQRPDTMLYEVIIT